MREAAPIPPLATSPSVPTPPLVCGCSEKSAVVGPECLANLLVVPLGRNGFSVLWPAAILEIIYRLLPKLAQGCRTRPFEDAAANGARFGQLLTKANSTIVALAPKVGVSIGCSFYNELSSYHDQVASSMCNTANYSLCINGEVTGNIKGRKGLRQGDPLSSYLFVSVMEVLTTLLKEKSHLPDFHFHWRCKDNQLINLCFADDLMMFYKGELPYIKHIRNALTEFEALSGLSPSPGKSSIFF
ncbi:hypothetical protein RHSIM_Rhsim12G0101000 [Rhododendron simsii]|uniref:Reverse transcriptase domain-containing protein n=1 Tax=Rhododendron simsii TaxID=118357 RepID=A0A834G8Y7_RHOSS|nr:hypothetical protein RHSIM_Rhsim12G0101000 [Rhododendron simsii]